MIDNMDKEIDTALAFWSPWSYWYAILESGFCHLTKQLGVDPSPL